MGARNPVPDPQSGPGLPQKKACDERPDHARKTCPFGQYRESDGDTDGDCERGLASPHPTQDSVQVGYEESPDHEREDEEEHETDCEVGNGLERGGLLVCS
jgi:hypothetical protein